MLIPVFNANKAKNISKLNLFILKFFNLINKAII